MRRIPFIIHIVLYMVDAADERQPANTPDIPYNTSRSFDQNASAPSNRTKFVNRECFGTQRAISQNPLYLPPGTRQIPRSSNVTNSCTSPSDSTHAFSINKKTMGTNATEVVPHQQKSNKHQQLSQTTTYCQQNPCLNHLFFQQFLSSMSRPSEISASDLSHALPVMPGEYSSTNHTQLHNMQGHSHYAQNILQWDPLGNQDIIRSRQLEIQRYLKIPIPIKMLQQIEIQRYIKIRKKIERRQKAKIYQRSRRKKQSTDQHHLQEELSECDKVTPSPTLLSNSSSVWQPTSTNHSLSQNSNKQYNTTAQKNPLPEPIASTSTSDLIISQTPSQTHSQSSISEIGHLNPNPIQDIALDLSVMSERRKYESFLTHQIKIDPQNEASDLEKVIDKN